MRDPNIYTTEAFKKLLRKWNLTTMGIKNELTHDWWTLIHWSISGCETMSLAIGAMTWNASQAGLSARDRATWQLEIDIYKREKAITERELKLARREIEIMRNQLRERATIIHKLDSYSRK